MHEGQAFECLEKDARNIHECIFVIMYRLKIPCDLFSKRVFACKWQRRVGTDQREIRRAVPWAFCQALLADFDIEQLVLFSRFFRIFQLRDGGKSRANEIIPHGFRKPIAERHASKDVAVLVKGENTDFGGKGLLRDSHNSLRGCKRAWSTRIRTIKSIFLRMR